MTAMQAAPTTPVSKRQTPVFLQLSPLPTSVGQWAVQLSWTWENTKIFVAAWQPGLVVAVGQLGFSGWPRCFYAM